MDGPPEYMINLTLLWQKYQHPQAPQSCFCLRQDAQWDLYRPTGIITTLPSVPYTVKLAISSHQRDMIKLVA